MMPATECPDWPRSKCPSSWAMRLPKIIRSDSELPPISLARSAKTLAVTPKPPLTGNKAKPQTMEVSDELGGGKKIKKMRESIRFSRLPGVATFFYKGSSLDVHPGFLTVWKTC